MSRSSSAESTPAAEPAEHIRAPRTRFAEHVGIFASLLLLAICAQVLVSGYTHSLGGYPDEPAHFLSSLMVRDYLQAGLPSSPMVYAENYYAHHPAIAIGYWPPLFYAVTGVWMLVFGFSMISVLLLLAVFCALLQYLLYWFGAKQFTKTQAFALAAVFPFIPTVSRSIALVMSDVFLSLWCFAATVSFALYLERPAARRAVAFGIFTSAAILTKAGGVFLLLLPALAVLASRRFELLRQRAFWIPAFIIGILCIPWFASTHALSTRGLLPTTVHKSFLLALAHYVMALGRVTGPLLLALAVFGTVLVLLRPAHAGWYAIAAQPLCLGVVLSLAPVYLETRYCIAAVPSVLLLAVYALRDLMHRVKAVPRLSFVLAPVLATALLASAGAPPRTAPGLAPALDYISRIAKPDSVILVSSVEAPEVLIAAELAVREPQRPGRTTIRANRLLAASDWNMTWYALRYATPDQVLKELQRRSVDIILVSSPGVGARTLPHHDLLLRTLEAAPERWQLAYGGRETKDTPYRVYVSTARSPVTQGLRRVDHDPAPFRELPQHLIGGSGIQALNCVSDQFDLAAAIQEPEHRRFDANLRHDSVDDIPRSSDAVQFRTQRGVEEAVRSLLLYDRLTHKS